MTLIPCENHSDREAYARVHFMNKWLCLQCFNALGDFDIKGKISDKRIKREEPKAETKDLNMHSSNGKAMSTETETKEQVSAPEETTKSDGPQFPGRKCVTCGSDKTAKRMSGKERWHKVEDGAAATATGSAENFQCHKCYEKARKAASSPSSS